MKALKEPKYIIAILVVVAVAFIGWNYTEGIKDQNAIEREKIESIERLKAAELQYEQEAQQAAEKATKDEETSRQHSLDICLQLAYTNYQQNWDSSCESISDEQETKYRNCVSSMVSYGTSQVNAERNCRNFWPELEKSECKLPTAVATRWDEAKATAEDACYTRYGFKK